MKPNQISNTAAFIAVKFYGLTRDDSFRALFDEEVVQFYDKLVQNLPAPLCWYHGGLQKPALRSFFRYWDELLLPGDLMHILMRKYHLTNWVKERHQEGYQQLLVLGSGFDHLGVICSARGMRCIELDAPRMIRMKRNFLSGSRYANANLSLQEAFFTEDSLYTILTAKTDPDPSLKTVVVAEGFFDYFTQEDGDQFIQDLNRFFSKGYTLLSTIFSLQELSGFRSFVYRNSIRLAGEALKLDLSQPAYLDFLKSHGFDIERCVSYKAMEQEVLTPRGIDLPVLPGFYLIEAKNERNP